MANEIEIKVGTKIHGEDIDAVVTMLSLDGYYCVYKDIQGRWKDIMTTDCIRQYVKDKIWTIE